jgi:predicted NUDIX family NTP pyrophosphohydrolase
LAGNSDQKNVTRDTFMAKWPPRSGRQQEFLEANRTRRYAIYEAKINFGQISTLKNFIT